MHPHLARPPSHRPKFEQGTFLSYDGTPIGYQVAGNQSGVPLLLANGLGGNVEAFRFLIHRFGHVFRFICWDYRGIYTSGRPLTGYDALSVEHNARDGLFLLREVLSIERCFAFGWSKGVQVLLELIRHGPAMVRGLMLHNGVAGRPYETVANTGRLKRVVPLALRALQRVDGPVTHGVRLAVDFPGLIPLLCRLGLVHHELSRTVFREMAANFKQLDVHLYLEALRRLGEHDARDVLPAIDCPTLLVASTHDQLTPLSVAEGMSREIRDCELQVIAGGTHYAAVEFPTLLNRHVLDWFTRRFPEVGVD
ncbi:MAG: alpha/beta fold hydrolase [Myxococcota bacterium]